MYTITRRSTLFKTSVALAVLLLSFNLQASIIIRTTLLDEVEECKEQLEFEKMPPDSSCVGNHTILIGGKPPFGGPTTRLGYYRLSDSVDAVFHCFTVDEANGTTNDKVEMIIHNRKNGKTCFFDRKGEMNANTPSISKLPSLDNVNATEDSDADHFWRRPGSGSDTGVGNFQQCWGCHVNGGPYFVRELGTAAGMAHFGLLNNGHDTKREKYSIFSADSEVMTHNNSFLERAYTRRVASINIPAGCGGSCHSFPFPADNTECCADGILGAAATNMLADGRMPPPLSDSPYRWFNIDTPNGTGDYETLSSLKEKDKYPDLACDSPTKVEAHVVGSDVIFNTTPFPARLKTFNLRDGLVCENASQAPGKCGDFSTSYLCNGEWTDWQSNDKPDKTASDTTDDESRSKYKNLCSQPTAIRAKATFKAVNPYNGSLITATYISNGPNDRLDTFSKSKGLVCKNTDQPSGSKCSNYVVRLTCP